MCCFGSWESGQQIVSGFQFPQDLHQLQKGILPETCSSQDNLHPMTEWGGSTKACSIQQITMQYWWEVFTSELPFKLGEILLGLITVLSTSPSVQYGFLRTFSQVLISIKHFVPKCCLSIYFQKSQLITLIYSPVFSTTFMPSLYIKRVNFV